MEGFLRQTLSSFHLESAKQASFPSNKAFALKCEVSLHCALNVVCFGFRLFFGRLMASDEP